MPPRPTAMRIAPCLSLLLALAAPPPARAQDLWLEPTPEAEAAAPTPTSVADLWPASTTVVTGEELRRRGYRTVGEALEDLVGVTVRRTTQGRRYGMRGVPSGLLLVIDGVPERAVGERDLLDVDEGLSLDEIERIEVVRGPPSALDGAGALAGAVRITTRSAGLTGTHTRVGATHLGQLELAAGVSWRCGEAGVRGSVFNRLGPEAPWRVERAPQRFIRVGRAVLPVSLVDADAELDADASTIARLTLESGPLRVDSSIVDTLVHSPLSSFSHGLLEPDDQQESRRRRIRLRVASSGAVAGAALETVIFGAHHRREDTIVLYPPEGSFPLGGRLDLRSDTLQAGVHLRALVIPAPHHRVVLGALAQASLIDAATDATDPIDGRTHPRLLALEAESVLGSLAAEYQADFGAGWHLTAGAALEGRTGYGASVAPRAAAVWFPAEALSLRLAYAEGTRAPDPWDLAALAQVVIGGDVVGAQAPTDLDPERARTGEAAVTWRPLPPLSLELVGFGTRHVGILAAAVEGPSYVLTNLEPRLIAGGELSLAAEILPGVVELTAGLTVTRVLDGPELEEDPVVATAAVTVTPGPRGLELGARTRNADVDLWGSMAWWSERILLAVSVSNLLGARETDIDTAAFPGRSVDVAIPSPGTIIWATLEARF